MSTYSHGIDMTEVMEQVKAAFEERNLRDKFFALAVINRSPEPDQLVRDANESIQKHPLVSLIGSRIMTPKAKSFIAHRADWTKMETKQRSGNKSRNPNPLEEHSQLDQIFRSRARLSLKTTICRKMFSFVCLRTVHSFHRICNFNRVVYYRIPEHGEGKTGVCNAW